MTSDVAPPTFAVVVPAYQATATIADAIASARAQTLPPAEIVVCDDGSTDDLLGALQPHRGAVTLLRQEHRGAAAARNALARAASADFLAPLDADDAFLPTRLERLGALATARPDLDLLATDAFLVRDGRRVGTFLAGTPFATERQREAILDRCFLINPAIRRSRLLEIGGYAEELRTCDDWDCYLRLLYAGAAAGLVDEPLYEYRVGGESLTADRAVTLAERVLMLEKIARRDDLLPAERRALHGALRRHRRRAREARSPLAFLARLRRGHRMGHASSS